MDIDDLPSGRAYRMVYSAELASSDVQKINIKINYSIANKHKILKAEIAEVIGTLSAIRPFNSRYTKCLSIFPSTFNKQMPIAVRITGDIYMDSNGEFTILFSKKATIEVYESNLARVNIVKVHSVDICKIF
jgi:hypothetical protein